MKVWVCLNFTKNKVIVAVVGEVNKENVNQGVANPSICYWESYVNSHKLSEGNFFKAIVVVLYFVVDEEQNDN